MNIAIISDTHDNTPAVAWIIDYLNKNKIPTAFHAGDLVSPGIIKRFRDHYIGHLHFVFGNNDGEIAGLTKISDEADNLTCHNQEMNLVYKNKKIYMNHYSDIALAHAKEDSYDICIGGHDHQVRVKMHNRTIFINPGNTVTKDKWLAQDHEKESTFIIYNLSNMTHQQITIDISPSSNQ